MPKNEHVYHHEIVPEPAEVTDMRGELSAHGITDWEAQEDYLRNFEDNLIKAAKENGWVVRTEENDG